MTVKNTILTSRRGFFSTVAKTGLITAAAFAAPQIMTRAAMASVPMSATMPSAFKRFKLGNFEITVLSDGHRIVPEPHGIFGMNDSLENVEALLTENYLPTGQMQFTFAPTLINTGEALILFDTGNGAGGREGGTGQTLANLQASGYTADQVTHVVLTHMHPDHIGGLTESDAPAFSNAVYVAGEVEYGFWSDDARKGTGAEGIHTSVKAFFADKADKLTLIGDGASPAPGITAMAAFGHTPGHMVYRIESEGRALVLTADTANHFVLSLQKPEWEVRFDANKEAAAQARKDVFGMLASERLPFIGYHMPFPSVGYVEASGTGFRYIPETYQLDL